MVKKSRGSYKRLLAVILSAALVLGNVNISDIVYAEEPVETTQDTEASSEEESDEGHSSEESDPSKEDDSPEETVSSQERSQEDSSSEEDESPDEILYSEDETVEEELSEELSEMESCSDEEKSSEEISEDVSEEESLSEEESSEEDESLEEDMSSEADESESVEESSSSEEKSENDRTFDFDMDGLSIRVRGNVPESAELDLIAITDEDEQIDIEDEILYYLNTTDEDNMDCPFFRAGYTIDASEDVSLYVDISGMDDLKEYDGEMEVFCYKDGEANIPEVVDGEYVFHNGDRLIVVELVSEDSEMAGQIRDQMGIATYANTMEIIVNFLIDDGTYTYCQNRTIYGNAI